MSRNAHSSGFESNSSLNSSAAAQQLFDRSQTLCSLVDKVPVLGLRLLSAPVSIDRNADYDKLIANNEKMLAFLLQVAEFAEVSFLTCSCQS